MERIFITGSSDGLGSTVAKYLVDKGYSVVLHARNAQRAKDATAACPGAETVVIGDVSSVAGTKQLAEDVNKLGTFDCVIHNAGLYTGPFRETVDGIPALAAVNTLAPYILTCLMNRPKRLVYVASEMHQSGDGSLEDILWKQRGEKRYDDIGAYRASKVHDIMFAKAFARRWPDVRSNALDPGWIATKMGGANATGSLDAAVETYALLAEGQEEGNGKYYNPGKMMGRPQAVTDDETAQERLLEICADFTGVKVPS